MNEKLSISDPNSNIEIFDDEADKINFINDYIIPIDAAKFVFFDAEKISEIANLSIKEEGSFINDALGKILGLDIYDTLVEDIELYINTLKKEGAKKNLQEQIVDKEKAIELSNIDIEKLEEENAEKLKEIDDLKKTIRQYNSLISQHSKQGNSTFDRDTVLAEIDKLKTKELELKENEQILGMLESGATDNFKREKAEADRTTKKELSAMNNLTKVKVEEMKDDKDIKNTKVNVLSRLAVEEMKEGED